MIRWLLLFTVFLGACASNQKFAQERLKDKGKNAWQVSALEIPCKKNVKECKANVKKYIGARSRKICKKQIFRVLKCDYNEVSSSLIAASCEVHCGEKPTGKDPVAPGASKPEENDEHNPSGVKEKSGDSKGFDWTDQ